MSAIATADDVRLDDKGAASDSGVIAVPDPSDPGTESGLSDEAINGYIEDVYFEASQAIDNYETELSDTHRRQLEKYAAALRIRKIADKPVSDTSRESASVTLEGEMPTIQELQRQVDRRDPSGTLAYNVDNDRYVNSTDES